MLGASNEAISSLAVGFVSPIFSDFSKKLDSLASSKLESLEMSSFAILCAKISLL